MALPLKDLFELPEGVIYLDGNSLGPLPKTVVSTLGHLLKDEWGAQLIQAWNTAGWMDQPRTTGERIAALIGAAPGTVATGDTLSIKVYQALAAALQMRPDARVILSDDGNFPSDLYMAQGLIDTIGKGHELQTPPPEEVEAHITSDVAAVMLTHVDYRSGRIHDMARITRAAHKAGAVMIWDLAHSAGAMDLQLAASQAEFAVGCTYKYLNGGPGAPAFIYVRPDLAASIQPALSGWLGHDAPFAMEPGYRPAMSTERMRIGTPPILQLAALNAALDVWDGIDPAEVRAASIALSERFIAEVERRCPMLTLASPRDPQRRGSHVSFSFENGYAAIQALIAEGVIGDFRAPDVMRFGITPLFLDEADILEAARRIEAVMTNRLWDNPLFMRKARVT